MPFFLTGDEDGMKVTVACVGKMKEKYLRDAVQEYSKRLSRYCKLEIIEAADEKTPDQASAAQEEGIKEKEGQRLLRRIPPDAYVITLEIEGDMVDSVAFSKRLEKLAIAGQSHLCFVIGGSLGLSEAVRRRAQWALSFSKMTFPHQLMRVIVLEQIYRAFRIQMKEPYHK